MTLARLCTIAIAACGMSIAGWAWAQADEPQTGAASTLASTHSDLAFMLLNGPRHEADCAEGACPARSATGAAALTLQVRRVAERLRRGASTVYPDLPQRIPGFARDGFDIYVAKGDKPGSASSASGKIALSASFDALQPYDDWLAFVIAREMGHVIARHHEENSGLGMITSLVMNLILPGSSLLKSAASAAGSSIASGLKRGQQVAEADTIALGLLEAAGFQLHDVSLSLRVAASRLDAGGWSQELQNSTTTVVFAARAAKRAAARALASTATATATEVATAAGFTADSGDTVKR